ncbi:MAG: hypothetical protein R3B45_09820 [Bdellovibrionota bacterium]
MKKFPKWFLVFVVIGIAVFVVFTAGNFADKPIIFAKGTIEISQELLSKAQGHHTMFLVVYDADSPMPMPYGAMRDTINVDSNNTTLSSFILTPQRLQIMRPDAALPKSLRLKVRIDQDGQGGMDQPGDLVGEVPRIALGSDGVTVKIDKLIQ